jgi:hypothetical protein
VGAARRGLIQTAGTKTAEQEDDVAGKNDVVRFGDDDVARRIDVVRFGDDDVARKIDVVRFDDHVVARRIDVVQPDDDVVASEIDVVGSDVDAVVGDIDLVHPDSDDVLGDVDLVHIGLDDALGDLDIVRPEVDDVLGASDLVRSDEDIAIGDIDVIRTDEIPLQEGEDLGESDRRARPSGAGSVERSANPGSALPHGRRPGPVDDPRGLIEDRSRPARLPSLEMNLRQDQHRLRLVDREGRVLRDGAGALGVLQPPIGRAGRRGELGQIEEDPALPQAQLVAPRHRERRFEGGVGGGEVAHRFVDARRLTGGVDGHEAIEALGRVEGDLAAGTRGVLGGAGEVAALAADAGEVEERLGAFVRALVGLGPGEEGEVLGFGDVVALLGAGEVAAGLVVEGALPGRVGRFGGSLGLSNEVGGLAEAAWGVCQRSQVISVDAGSLAQQCGALHACDIHSERGIKQTLDRTLESLNRGRRTALVQIPLPQSPPDPTSLKWATTEKCKRPFRKLTRAGQETKARIGAGGTTQVLYGTKRSIHFGDTGETSMRPLKGPQSIPTAARDASKVRSIDSSNAQPSIPVLSAPRPQPLCHFGCSIKIPNRRNQGTQIHKQPSAHREIVGSIPREGS